MGGPGGHYDACERVQEFVKSVWSHTHSYAHSHAYDTHRHKYVYDTHIDICPGAARTLRQLDGLHRSSRPHKQPQPTRPQSPYRRSTAAVIVISSLRGGPFTGAGGSGVVTTDGCCIMWHPAFESIIMALSPPAASLTRARSPANARSHACFNEHNFITHITAAPSFKMP